MDTFHPIPTTTTSAEGLPRRKWSVDDIVRMQDAGIIGVMERLELIGGEIVPMSPKGVWHEDLKRKLNVYFARALPADFGMVTETSLYATGHDFYEPDFIFWPEAVPFQGLKPKDLSLLIEVSDSSLAYDTGRKRTLYAGFGLREYWVINARTFRTCVHRDLADGDFRSVDTIDYMERLVPTLVPALAIRIADLGLTPVND
jgi:Uma2 family endonuclease